jgi:hypothetical protein
VQKKACILDLNQNKYFLTDKNLCLKTENEFSRLTNRSFFTSKKSVLTLPSARFSKNRRLK